MTGQTGSDVIVHLCHWWVGCEGGNAQGLFYNAMAVIVKTSGHNFNLRSYILLIYFW